MEISQKPKTSPFKTLFSFLQIVSVRLFAVGVMYTAGYYSINPIWLVIAWGLIKYRDYRRESQRSERIAAHAVALRSDRLLVLSNAVPPPSWVTFTDTDRCQWVNEMIRHLWPSIQPILVHELKNLEPTLNEALSKYKKNLNFTFNEISIGTLTPRVSGVRVNDVGNFKGSIADVFIFFVSDAVFKCSIKTHIGFGCNNFVFKGCLRVIVSTPSTSSRFPAVEFFFLQKPNINFNLTGILNLGDIPGIRGWLRSAVGDVIESKIVHPNKMAIKYDDKVHEEELNFPDPLGLLTVNVLEAKALGGKDNFSYSSTKQPRPSVSITYGSKTFYSPIVENSRDPVWNFKAEFIVETLFDSVVLISVDDINKHYNTNTPNSNELEDTMEKMIVRNLGSVTLSVKTLSEKQTFNSWMPLVDAAMGMVHLDITYQRLEHNPERLNSGESPVVLEIFIGEAENLERDTDKIVAEVSVEGSTQSSRPVPLGHPVFMEKFAFLVQNPQTEQLRIKLIKESDDKALGHVEVFIKQVLEADNMEVLNEKNKIVGANENSMLPLSMRLRTIKL